MSSGACRALVALLLLLVALTGLTLPVAANSPNLDERSDVIYSVDPSTGDIDVEIQVALRAASRQVPAGVWGPIVVEDMTKPRLNSGFQVHRFEDLPGLWRAMYVSHNAIPEGESANLRIRYRLNASVDQAARRASTPARVDPSYVYACVPGQDTDGGEIRLSIPGEGGSFVLDQSGSIMEQDGGDGLTSGFVDLPNGLFTCVEGTREENLVTEQLLGPDGRTIVLQAWQEFPSWLSLAERNSDSALRSISAFLGLAIPGEGPIIIRQSPPRLVQDPPVPLGGYASDHDTRGIVQLDETGGLFDPEHELAHVWFGTDNIGVENELWLREGLAEWTASSMHGEACAPVETNDDAVELGDWKVVKPFSNPDTVEQLIRDQETAACGIMTAVADRMSPEQWREVLGSMLQGETKYVGSGAPGKTSTNVVNYQEWLDAVDERGLVPAGRTDPAFAGNLEDLDFAQNLLDVFGADVDPVLLAQRSEARARYHEFLDTSPLGVPVAVRKALDDWDFPRAMSAMDKAQAALDALGEAEDLLPTAPFTLIVQPMFESAGSEEALDEVVSQALAFRDTASELFEPLSQLQQAQAPAGWSLPGVVGAAITGQRFDEILEAVPPALSAVEDLTSADDFLPQARLLERYQPRYEGTSSVQELEDLATEAADVVAAAERTSAALADLQASANDWTIPTAVTEPLENGRINTGFAIVNDARAVVKAATDANLALPDANLRAEIQPRFEAVTTGEEMAALRVAAEARRDQAESIGGALAALRLQAPEWQTPAVISDPIATGDFATAAEVAAVAKSWIENAYEANTTLPAMDAINRSQQDFEAATTLDELKAGASRAENWNLAADRVAEAQVAIDRPRDLMAEFGLWGVDLQPPLREAVQAAIDGDLTLALNRAATVIETANGASSGGALRLAGIVFLGVAILGVLGLWLILRREAGPPWARSTKPHWVDDKKDGPRLLGRGKTNGKKNDKKGK